MNYENIIEENWQRPDKMMNVNVFLLAMHIFCPLMWVACFYVFDISLRFLGITFLLCCILFLLKKIRFNFKGVIYPLRAAVIISFAACYIPFLILVNFSHTKIFHSVRREDYIYGACIKEMRDIKSHFLPEGLPDICENYYFMARGNVWVQDYSQDAHLIFNTDADTIEQYREYYKSIGCKKFDIPDIAVDGRENYYTRFCRRMGFDDEFKDDVEHNEFYVYTEKEVNEQPMAVLLNPETGLVAIYS